MTNHQANSPDYFAVLLSTMRALWGVITTNIRRVGAQWTWDSITLVCVHDGLSDEDLIDDMRGASSEIAADFPSIPYVDERLVRIDSPALIEETSEWAQRPGSAFGWAYVRKETMQRG